MLAWRDSPRRKPLLLGGARQVGKTWLLKEFGKSFANAHYLNFEEDSKLSSLFSDSRAPRDILRKIELYTGKRIAEEHDLLIFDEVQLCNDALNSLKYFSEKAPKMHLAAAGSLLGIKLSGPRSFPVGKVDFIDLQPMSFLEFLDAHDRSDLRELIAGHRNWTPLADGIHHRLVELLRSYLFVGGMPEAVSAYLEEGAHEARQVQRSIVRAYQLDFAKYAAPTDAPKLSLIWESIPTFLARENSKFVYSVLRKGARARGYEDALTWLKDARLILKCLRVTQVGWPLRAQADPSAFKIYAHDVGLLAAMADVPASKLVEPRGLFDVFRGALTENYVAQELAAQGLNDLYYWSSSGGRAETDFLLAVEGEILPLEAKSGINPRSRSLRSYAAQFAPRALLHASLLNYKRQESLFNYPLYAASQLASHLEHSARSA